MQCKVGVAENVSLKSSEEVRLTGLSGEKPGLSDPAAAGEKKSSDIFACMSFLVFLSRLWAFVASSSQVTSGKIANIQLPFRWREEVLLSRPLLFSFPMATNEKELNFQSLPTSILFPQDSLNLCFCFCFQFF